jgi:hypothetical protein
MPNKPKGRRYPIEISGVAWMDLLGYGSMLSATGFDPSSFEAQSAVERLECFQQNATKVTHRVFQAMPINDGIAYFKDLSPRSNSVTADFLKRSIDAYNLVNKKDQENGYPGARMVIAAGPRLRINDVVKHSKGHLSHIFSRLKSRQISARQAINEAFFSSPIAGFVPSLQANFAFTRAYLADESGSKKGISGPNCFISLDFFDVNHPEWISFKRIQPWEQKGLKCNFGELDNLDWDLAGRTRYSGIRNSLEIADAQGIRYAEDYLKIVR